ncbi:putative xyloglucan endotransglucosylase/hydrolase protein 28 [Zea mays]|uniref:Putative xyloglucan endotransglucosylase/hydrolase protein 28 n=1 Tax=Zea mays TaxID=4577 RepID=A0A1D6I3X8_MAIZE|nr:putative xyloglucan endotransglucosylase/hydrolase protein 28 [Zea mays]
MASSASCTLLLPTLSLAVILLALCARGGEARPPPPLHGVRPLAFDEGYTQIFGSANLALLRDGRRVRLTLDESTGAGFASQDVFLHGFFSAAIKLPADYAAGVVVAFYLSNGDVYEKTHDELDFEFLGNVAAAGRGWLHAVDWIGLDWIGLGGWAGIVRDGKARLIVLFAPWK